MTAVLIVARLRVKSLVGAGEGLRRGCDIDSTGRKMWAMHVFRWRTVESCDPAEATTHIVIMKYADASHRFQFNNDILGALPTQEQGARDLSSQAKAAA